MDSIAPNIFVNNMNETINFYRSLGFELKLQVPEEGDLVWAMMSCGNVNFMFQSKESLGSEIPQISRKDGGSLLFYIRVHGIRDFFANIEGQVQVLKGLEKTFYGATEFSIVDNNNYVLTFAEDE